MYILTGYLMKKGKTERKLVSTLSTLRRDIRVKVEAKKRLGMNRKTAGT